MNAAVIIRENFVTLFLKLCFSVDSNTGQSMGGINKIVQVFFLIFKINQVIRGAVV